MTAHKFETGQTVMIVARRSEETPSERFSLIARALPIERGVKQYRTKYNTDGDEHAAREAELS